MVVQRSERLSYSKATMNAEAVCPVKMTDEIASLHIEMWISLTSIQEMLHVFKLYRYTHPFKLSFSIVLV